MTNLFILVLFILLGFGIVMFLCWEILVIWYLKDKIRDYKCRIRDLERELRLRDREEK